MTQTQLPTESRRQELLARYEELTEHVLPSLAKSGTYPVRFDHCFQRIILDNIYGQKWDTVIERPAKDHMDIDELKQAIDIARSYVEQPEICEDHNKNSLEYRDKL